MTTTGSITISAVTIDQLMALRKAYEADCEKNPTSENRAAKAAFEQALEVVGIACEEPKVKQPKAKLTVTQQEAIDKAMRLYNDAQMSFEDWFMHSNYCNTYGKQYDSFEDAVEKSYRWLAQRDRKNDQEGYIREMLEWDRSQYEQFRKGIVYMHGSSNTLRALERKGYIRIIVDGGRRDDKAQLLCI